MGPSSNPIGIDRTKSWKNAGKGGTMREDKREKKNSGFTLVEVLIAVAILAVVTIPVIQSFVSVAQVNGKSRRRLAALTVAESVMEACKSMPLSEFAAQCGYFSATGTAGVPFTIVSGNLNASGGSYSFGNFSGSASELKIASSKFVKVTNDNEKSAQPIATGSKQYKLKENPAKKYYFWIGGIEMGNGKYDAVITYTLNTDRSKVEATYDPWNDLSAAGLRTLRFYEIKIDVYRSLATFEDTLYGIDSNKIITVDGSVSDYIDPKS